MYYENIVPLEDSRLRVAAAVGPSHSGGMNHRDEQDHPREKNYQGEVPNNDVIEETAHPNQVPSDPRAHLRLDKEWAHSVQRHLWLG